MRKGHRKERYALGDLVAALFEESSKTTKSRLEQNILVYAALKDLLKGRVQSYHKIALRGA